MPSSSSNSHVSLGRSAPESQAVTSATPSRDGRPKRCVSSSARNAAIAGRSSGVIGRTLTARATSRFSARPVKLCSSTSGCGSASSPSRLIQIVRRPSAEAGAMSWKRLAPTWTCCSRSAPLRAKNSSQWAGAGLYEPISDATTVRSNSTPIRASDASRRSRSVFERTASRQPRGPGLLERRRHLGERLPLRQRASERVLLAGGSAETGERDGHHLAVAAAGILPLDLRLELVVGVQQLAAARSAEQPLELAPDAAVPVDQRAVAVEGRPALHAGEPTSAAS